MSNQPTSFVRGLQTNSTATAFPNSGNGPIATTTQPATVDSSTPTSNRVVITLGGTHVDLIFFGADAADEAFDARLTLWRRIMDPGGNDDLWLPVILADLTVTLGAKTGVSGAALGTADLLADLIAGDAYNDDASGQRVQIFSPGSDATGANLFGMVTVRTDRYELLSIDFDLDTALSANVAYAKR